MNSKNHNPQSAGAEADAGIGGIPAAESDPLHKELAAQKNLNLHLTADFENFKRRSRQEVETRAAEQKEMFMHELLPVIDNLERALASGASSHAAKFHQGVEMTLQQLRHLLLKPGVETEEIVGKPFDAYRHEALSQRRDPAQPDHTILEVFQRGYRRGEKVFRAAKVVVNDLSHSKRSHHGR